MVQVNFGFRLPDLGEPKLSEPDLGEPKLSEPDLGELTF